MITAHKGLHKPNHSNYNESIYNFIIELKNRDINSECLSIIGADSSVNCAIYARKFLPDQHS